MGKLFDLHIEVGYEGINSYAKTIVNSYTVKMASRKGDFDAIQEFIKEAYLFGLFGSLRKSPSMSVYPFSTLNIMSGHEVKQYDLHFEFGTKTIRKEIYIKTHLEAGQNTPAKTYSTTVPAGVDMIHNFIGLINQMDRDNVFPILSGEPDISVFPFGSSSTSSHSSTSVPRAVLVEEANKDIVRKLPSHIIDIPHPHCKDHCTSWDIFGKIKCPNMCEWRPEV